jgi:hypothetical protein
MSNYQKNDFYWQWRQTQQRFTEWLEQLQFQPPKRSTEPRPTWNLEWVAEWVTWCVIALLAVLLVLLLFQAWKQGRLWWLGRELQPKSEVLPEMPIYRTRSMNEWQREAQKFQQQGNFTEAARSLYFAMLNHLDDRKLVPQQVSRTDGEYRQLITPLPHATAFQILLQTHEQIEFAGLHVSSEQYQRCQQAYRDACQTGGR